MYIYHTSFFCFKDTPWNQKEQRGAPYSLQYVFPKAESCFHEGSVFGEPNNVVYGRSGEQAAGKECEGNRDGNVVTEAL